MFGFGKKKEKQNVENVNATVDKDLESAKMPSGFPVPSPLRNASSSAFANALEN